MCMIDIDIIGREEAHHERNHRKHPDTAVSPAGAGPGGQAEFGPDRVLNLGAGVRGHHGDPGPYL